MIHVIATVELQPGTRQCFLDEFAQVVPKVRAEVGCIEYGAAVDLATSIPVQVPMRPDVATIVEKWSGLEQLNAHLVAPHMKAYRERVRPFVMRTTLQVLEPVAASAA
ncbi:MAG TPA: putative quinol monooxygenase [Burkholderiales bacterium]|nr:putative quinol monooxygenase [Burkholderiales bacterium]